ncbi:MAG: succinate dehydrogenase assembly factor 2 [Pseudomonadota bacterium]
MPLNLTWHRAQKTALSADFETTRRKLLFLCKRGNLESELLLIAFIETVDWPLSPEKIQLFELFLAESDQDLLCWLLKHNPQAPTEKVDIPAKYQALIAEIRLNYLK